MIKSKFIILLIAIMLSISFANAEMNLWNNAVLDKTNSIVKYHAFYVFDDTSSKGIGKNKDVPVIVYYNVQALPYNLTGGAVDWCNLSITSFHNIYGTDFIAFQGFFGGQLLNTTTDTQSYYFGTGGASNGQITLNMRDKDNAIIDMSCHYTDPNYLYQDNVLVGRFTTYLSSYECEKCTQYYEEVSNEADYSDELTQNELGIYNKVQSVITWDYQVWLIASWVIKIAILFIAVALIFSGAYFFYSYLKKLGNSLT